ncbi:MAG: IgGFc-binding protein, partial [Bacteroidota bacterium]|nr:IgGFc-binding protein [Bacteroidota bacterium]
MDGGKPNRYLLFLKRTVFLFLLTGSSFYSRAQTPYSVGTSFTTTFFYRGAGATEDSLNTYSFFLYSEFSTCGFLEIPGIGQSIPFILEPDSAIQISLSYPQTYRSSKMQIPLDNSVIIRSQRPIAAVNGINIGNVIIDSVAKTMGQISQWNEASSLIPDHLLSNKYFDISLSGEYVHSSRPTSAFIYLSTRFENQIQYSLSTNSYDRPWVIGAPHKLLDNRRVFKSLNLLPNQSIGFFISSLDSIPPYTVVNKPFNNSIGSCFSGSKPFSIISSSLTQTDSFLVYGGGLGFEQLFPPKYSGTSFLFPKLLEFQSNSVTILSLTDSNSISINGAAPFFLDSLESMSDAIKGDIEISSTGKLLVLGGNRFSDSVVLSRAPIVLSILPKENLITRAYSKSIESFDTSVSYYLTLICPNQSQNTFTLDGQVITPTFTSFSHTPGWSYTQIKLKKGDHIIENPLGFQGYLYSPWKSLDPITPKVSYGINLISLDSVGLDPNQYSFKASKKGTNPILFSDFTDSLCQSEYLMIHLPDVSHTDWNIDWGDGSSVQVSVEDSIPRPVSHAYSMTGSYTIYVNDISGCEEPDSLLVYVREGELPDFYGEIISTCEGRFFTGQVNGASSEVGWAFSTGDSIVGNPI